jgi:hypothetical protein
MHGSVCVHHHGMLRIPVGILRSLQPGMCVMMMHQRPEEVLVVVAKAAGLRLVDGVEGGLHINREERGARMTYGIRR